MVWEGFTNMYISSRKQIEKSGISFFSLIHLHVYKQMATCQEEGNQINSL